MYNLQNGSSTSSAVETLEFRPLGIEWVVRRPGGERFTFNSLSRLRIALYNQTISTEDELSFNRDLWRRIDEVPDLRAYFWMVWQRAQRGGLPGRRKTLVGTDNLADARAAIDEFDDEVLTHIVGVQPLVAPAMQVTIPCFTDEQSRRPGPVILGPGEFDDGFEDEAPTRIVGAPTPTPRGNIFGPVIAPHRPHWEDTLVLKAVDVLQDDDDFDESAFDDDDFGEAETTPPTPREEFVIRGVFWVSAAVMMGGAFSMISIVLLQVVGVL